MIPMHPMDSSSSGSNNRKRQTGQNKQKFDYSSRIYYQTDGHPQYIGLPLDHPDPEDEEAVAAYLRKKEAGRLQRRQHSGDGSSNRRSSWRTRRRRSKYGSSQNAAQDSKPAETRAPSAAKTRKSTGEATSSSGGSAKKQGSEKARGGAGAAKQRPVKAPAVSHEEYQGTALTDEQSATAILHSALYGDTETPSVDRFQATDTGEKQALEAEVSAAAEPEKNARDAGDAVSKPRRRSSSGASRRRTTRKGKPASDNA